MSGLRERRGRGFLFAFLLVMLLPSTTCFAGTPWKFIVTGDSRGSDNGVSATILSEIAAEIVSQNVDFVLFPGDLVTGSSTPATLESQLTTWRTTMQPVYDAGIDVYVVRGNHDTGSVTAWNNVFPELPDNGPTGEENLTYSVAHKNAFVLALDQYVSSHRVNQRWVDAQLSANVNPHVFAFGHEPAFSVGHADCLDDYPNDRDAFWTSLEDAGGRTYFTGHDHFYDHTRVDDDGDPDNDLHQLIVGTAGAPLYTWSGSYGGDNSGYSLYNVNHAESYGYVVVEINGLDATLTWMEQVAAGNYQAAQQWSYTAIPEPAVFSLMVLGALTTIWRRT